MSKLELFSRVSVKSPNLSSQPRSSGVEALSNEEIISCLAGVPASSADWIYFQYMNDRSLEDRVTKHLFTDADEYVKTSGYRLRKETVYGLVKVAISEARSPVCPVCNGNAYKELVKAHDMKCPHCHGTGKNQLTIRAICRTANIDNKAYSRNHQDVLNHICSTIGDIERSVANHVAMQLSEQ